MTIHRAGLLFASILLALSTGIVDGQAPANVLVIDGGTLIDGNGGAPIRDVQIVVRGNRATAIPATTGRLRQCAAAAAHDRDDRLRSS